MILLNPICEDVCVSNPCFDEIVITVGLIASKQQERAAAWTLYPCFSSQGIEEHNQQSIVGCSDHYLRFFSTTTIQAIECKPIPIDIAMKAGLRHF